MFTECPSCNTFFRISPDQLKAAAGKVRCGNCGGVFNAVATLTETLPASNKAPAAKKPADGGAFDETSFENVEVPGTGDEELGGFEIAPEEEPLSNLEDLFAEDEGGITKGFELEDLDDEIDSNTGYGRDETGEEHLSTLFVDDEPEDLGAPLTEAEVFSEADSADDERFAENFANDNYVLEEISGQAPEPPKRSIAKGVWGGVIALLIVVLTGQYVYFQRAELARYPALKPWLDSMCGVIGQYIDCDIPPPRDLATIRLVERDVRSHPDLPNTLLITATIVNDAPFDQPFPNMQLRFSDINQKAVAKKKFTPKEYLGKDADMAAGMKSGVPVRISLKIIDPGEQAVNFEFLFVR